MTRTPRWLPALAGFFLCLMPLLASGQPRTLEIGARDAPQKERRVALVIGNGAYKFSPLKNPVNDARAMAASLRGLGFDVALRENLSRISMELAVREFGNQLRGGGEGVFYYAGHGMQIKGRNFLLPVDANIESEEEVPYFSVDANLVLDKMEAARNPVNIMILDACRNNPFMRSARGPVQGLAAMDAPTGVLIAFATAPGSVSYDGDGANGVYTKYLVREIEVPGLAVEQMFKRVRIAVSRETREKQIPWESSSLKGDFYFNPKPAVNPVTTAPPVSDAAIEIAFWESIRNSENPADYTAYLEQFPHGRFASLARIRVNRSQNAAPTPTPPKPIAEANPPPASRPAVAAPTPAPATPFPSAVGNVILALAPDISSALVAAPGQRLMLKDTKSGKELRPLDGQGDAILAAAFGPDGRTIVTTARDRTMTVWEFATGRVLERLTGVGYGAFALSQDSRYGIFALAQGGVDMRDMLTKKSLKTLDTGAARVEKLAYNPNGRDFAAAASDGSLNLWDVATGRNLNRFDTERTATRTLEFSPDGRRLLAAGSDGRVRLWDIADGKRLARFSVAMGTPSAPGTPVRSAFVRNSDLVVTVAEKSIQFWKAEREEAISRQESAGTLKAFGIAPGGKSIFAIDAADTLVNIPVPSR